MTSKLLQPIQVGNLTFKNRIMFPLHDPYGKIVGFSGRIYEDIDKDKNKYLNNMEAG